MSQWHANQAPEGDCAEKADTAEQGNRPSEKFRLAIWFSVHGQLRFLSHRDTMELWRRLLVRADIALRFSQGFNPHPKLTLPLPRSVGMSAENELLLVELNEKPGVDSVLERIEAQSPAGLRIEQGRYVSNKAPAVALWAEYSTVLSDKPDMSLVEENVKKFNSLNHWNIEREQHGRHKERCIDLKEHVKKLKIQKNDSNTTIWCRIYIGDEATPRIGEIHNEIGLTCGNDIREVTRVAAGYPVSLQMLQSNKTDDQGFG